jgi:pilus assembly protein CpaF
MVAMAGFQLPPRAVKEQIASAINVVVQVARLSDGARRVTSISEITGMEESVITMQEIFTFERQGIDEQGKVVGRFRSTGIRPRFADRLRVSGIVLPIEMFEDEGEPEPARRHWSNR